MKPVNAYCNLPPGGNDDTPTVTIRTHMSPPTSTNFSSPRRRLPQTVKIALLLGAAAGLIGVTSRLLSRREPTYDGRKISVWLRNYPQYKQVSWRENETAMRACGTNGIPYVMRELTRKPSAWEKLHGNLWHRGPLWIKQAIGLPKMRLNPDYAPEIFGAIGTNAIPILIEALKLDDPTAQRVAILALGYFGPRANAALPELENCLIRAQTNQFQSWTISSAMQQIDPVKYPRPLKK